MNFLKPSKLKIILTIPLFVVGVFATILFMFLALGDLLDGGFFDRVFQILSFGGIIGLMLVDFLPTITLAVLAGIIHLFWSYFLSCSLVFLGRKLFSR